jgi:2-methylisocitrate lyase-like PEP mutase family enzyme
MVEKGRTPVLSKADLEALNFKLAIFPVTALLAGVQAMTQVYKHFKSTGSSVGGKTDLYDFTDLTKLMGFEEVWDFDKKHAD